MTILKAPTAYTLHTKVRLSVNQETITSSGTMGHIPLARLASLSKVLNCALVSFREPTGGMTGRLFGIAAHNQSIWKEERSILEGGQWGK